MKRGETELTRIVLLVAACLASPSPGGAQAVAAKVTVTLSATSYAQGETIRFTIGNGLPSTLYAEDSQSACEIAMLERRATKAWEALWGCSFERAPALVAIPARGLRHVAIDPSSPHLEPFRQPDKPAVGPGTYRIRFTYRLDPGPLTGAPETAVSPSFEIRH